MINGPSQFTKWTLALAVTSIALIGCRADDLDTSDSTEDESRDVVEGDTVVVTETDTGIDGRLILQEVEPESGELEELNRVPVENGDELYQGVDPVPEVSVIQGQFFDQPDRWAIVDNVEDGDLFALSPFTHLAFLLAERDGFANLDAQRTETLNTEVAEALAPGVIDLKISTGEFPDLGEDGELGLADSELLALYRLGLENLAQTREEDERAIEDQLNDGGSGVVDGRDASGAPIDGVQYDPLTFVPVYETELGALAAEFGSDALNSFITGDDENEGIETARFISRDARCDDGFAADYFSANEGMVTLPATEVSGPYSELFEEGEEYGFEIQSDGTVLISTGAGFDEGLMVTRESLFTCSQTAFDGTQERSLARYVSDITQDEQREELVLFGDDEEALAGEGDNGGFYLASESGDRLAVFGDVNPRGGHEEPAQDEDQMASSCAARGYDSFGLESEGLAVESDSTGLAGVSNEGLAVDGDPETAASLNVALGLLGIGSAEIIASADSSPMEDADNALALVSIPDSILNLSLLDSITVETFQDGDEVASNVNLNLLELDLGGLTNDENMRALEIESGAFDSIRVYINAGVLGTDIRLQVHDFCYGPVNTD